MSRTPHGDPVAADAFLHVVADQLITELRDDDLEPALVHLADDGTEDLQIGMLPLHGRHPTELLLGFTAPSDWHAIGLASRGWAYSIADRARGDRTRSRVHLVTLLSRTGEVANRVHVADGPDVSALAESLPDEATGEQIDLLRRVLSLPTDPPPCGTEVYWSIEWLSALLGAPPAELASWADVANHHPAIRLLLGSSDHEVPLGRHQFVAVVGAFLRVFDWPSLRRMIGDDRFVVPELGPADALWLDDGALARFVLNRCPPLTMLRSQVAEHLPDHLAQQLDETLDVLGVPTTAWPDDLGDRAA